MRKNEKKINGKKIIFVDRTVFFPEEKILALGDLHIGYEHMMRNQGIMIPLNQTKRDLKDITKIIENLKKQKHFVEKIIILGDLKHHFGFQSNEKFDIRDFLKNLEKIEGVKKVILIRGNHERIELDKREYKEYYKEKGLFFIHGDKLDEELKQIVEKNNNQINFIIMGHLHPAITLSDNMKIKVEKFKCYLIGKWKKKKVIILPSFFSPIEGTDVKSPEEEKKFGIVPKNILKNFDVYAIGKKDIYNFGKLKNIK